MNNMNFKVHRKRISVSIVVFFITIFLITFLCNNVKAQNLTEGGTPNMLYVKIVNFTMPMIKSTSFDDEDLAEYESSLKGKFLSLAGIDLKRPSSILSKEMVCSRVSAHDLDSVSPAKDVSFNSFAIDEKEISRQTEQEENPNNEKSSDNDNSVMNVYEPKLKKKLDTTKPEILIYHSHTTESYSDGSGFNADESKNVCAVGDVLQNELEKNYGISVIHDKTVHNAYSYTKSYNRSGETLDKYLKKYGDFKLVIDIHRDAGQNKKAVTTQMNGENVAKVMFVMARKNPHFKYNIAVVNKLVACSDKLYPGFCKGIHYVNRGIGYYNQNKSNNAFLIEVGADVNTLNEAKASSKYLARIIGEYINGKK